MDAKGNELQRQNDVSSIREEGAKMRIIQEDKHNLGTISVSWMWLPTFIGQNQQLLKEIDRALSKEFPPPLKVDEEKLDEIHRFVIDHICGKLKIPGLRYYLEALEFIGANMPQKPLSPSVDWEAVDRGEEVLDRRMGILIRKVVDEDRTTAQE